MSSIYKNRSGFTRQNSEGVSGGFAVLEVVILVVMAALVVLAGWWVYQRSQDEDESAEKTTTQMEEQEAPEVEQPADLENAEQYLQDLDIEGDLNTKEFDDTLAN